MPRNRPGLNPTVNPGVCYNHGPFGELQFGDLGLDVWVRQQRLLDSNNLLSISVCMYERPELDINLDLVLGQVDDGLVEIVLGTRQ